jgi:hypothetical protein
MCAYRRRSALPVPRQCLALVAVLLLGLAPPTFAQPAAPVVPGHDGLVTAPLTGLTDAPGGESPGGSNAETPVPLWAVNFDRAPLYAAPDEASDSFGVLRQFTYLQILGYEDVWARVYNPRTRTTAYVRSDLLGPADVPPPYVTAEPPPALEEINSLGRVVRGTLLAFFPTPAEEAQVLRLGHNTPAFIVNAVTGEDGESWYRTLEGDYLPSAAVRLPRPPPRMFSGRWIDVDLREPALLTAYEDDRVVMNSLVIKGTATWQTPVGLFAIRRRVANETMDSATVGLPRDAPGGYYLKDVLFTQYFTGGASIHYNYWSSVWGYAGSHGCLGLPYAESAFLWDWAS